MKKVLITGGSRGIGAAMARLFAENGYSVFITYKKNHAAASAVGAAAFCADVTDFRAMHDVIEKTGGVDVLINNAGIAEQKLFSDITPEDWARMIGVNLTGVYNCCHAALPYMIRKKSGCIINVSSMWGICGASCEVHYSAAKAGVIGLTKALAKEVAPSGITVNCIAPGAVDTDMNKILDPEDIELLKEETPLGRLGTPEEIAKCALYLAENGGFMTGQVLSPNGGIVI